MQYYSSHIDLQIEIEHLFLLLLYALLLCSEIPHWENHIDIIKNIDTFMSTIFTGIFCLLQQEKFNQHQET